VAVSGEPESAGILVDGAEFAIAQILLQSHVLFRLVGVGNRGVVDANRHGDVVLEEGE